MKNQITEKKKRYKRNRRNLLNTNTSFTSLTSLTTKYQTGIIYKIFHKTIPNIVYIGSTICRLSTRWKRHKTGFSKWKNGYTKSKCSICPYFKEYGIKNFDCIMLKKYIITDLYHLNAYEQIWINKIKNININKVFNPIKHYKKYYNRLNKIKKTDKIAKLTKQLDQISI